MNSVLNNETQAEAEAEAELNPPLLENVENEAENAENKDDLLENENNILLKLFLETYPEFKPLLENNRDDILKMFNKIVCLYPSYKQLLENNCVNLHCLVYPFFMLVAHYLVVNGFGAILGITKPNGLMASSSIDSVSVSYQTSPFKDNFQFFFSQTSYGLEYLAYLNSQSGLMLIN